MPSYHELLETGELTNLIQISEEILNNCTLCPHNCRVNRFAGKLGFCKSSINPLISSYAPHFGEEPILVGNGGSGTIFFARCNLNCVFCQNYDISQPNIHALKYMEEISSKQLAKIMLSLQDYGCTNINLVSPTHFVPQIIKAIYFACIDGLQLPIVYNCGGYENTETLKLLDGIVDIYLPDFKYSDNDFGEKYSNAKKYYDIAKASLVEMQRQVGDLQLDDNNVASKGLIIRHLVLPNRIAGSKLSLQFIYENISKNACVNIMKQYFPTFKAHQYKELSRRITKDEFNEVILEQDRLGLPSCC